MRARSFFYVCAGLFLLALYMARASNAEADAVTVFRGRPAVKVSEGGFSRVAEKVARNAAINLECVVSQIGEQFYWASRENKRMYRMEAGVFITYVAVDGSGYVRTVIPELKHAATLISETEARFEYVEHLLSGLRSVTYYGVARF